MLRYSLTLSVLFLFLYSLQGQLSQGGTPPSFEISTQKNVEKIKRYKLRKLRIEKLVNEETEITERLPYSQYKQVDIDLKRKASKTETEKGVIWRYNVVSKNAFSIGLIFSHYEIPSGAKLYVYSSDREIIYGAFTEKNNKESHILAIADLSARDIIIEYFEPFDAEFTGKLVIGKIGQAFRKFGGNTDKAADSFIEVNCPEGDDVQLEKHAVARMSFEESGTGYLCTGALINNTRNDGTPYFLTANHCISSDNAANTLITWFNFEQIDCYSGQPNGVKSLSGSSLKATYEPSDMTLLLLDNIPPPEYQPYYAGWNALPDTVSGKTSAVHHPSGKFKKVSLDYDPATILPSPINWDEGSPSPENSHWLVSFDKGMTSGGSSGGPLFNENKRIIGQLHGGGDTYDLYGRLAWSWGRSEINSESLKSWLDPDISDTLVYDGYIPADNLIEAIPLIDFQGVCIGEPVQLLDGSLFSPTSWNWSFSPSSVDYLEGTNSTSANPVVAFTENTSYTVSLNSANSISSDSRSREGYIQASDNLTPSMVIDSKDIYYCLFDSFYIHAEGASNYVWNIEGELKYIRIDSANFTTDRFVIYRNDSADVDSNFTVIISLSSTQGNCSTTVSDTLNFFYPYNDDIEDAYPLKIGFNGSFHNYCASVQDSESNPPEGECNSQDSWCGCEVSDTIIDNSVWFTFIGPESGIVTIDAPGFDNQIAIYDANSAEDIISGDENNYTIIAANDDYYGVDEDYASRIVGAVIEPGKKYWLQVDGSACGTSGEFTLELFDNDLTALDEENNLLQSTTQLYFYPNPASKYLVVQNIVSSSELSVKIISIDGRTLITRNMPSVNYNEEIKIDFPEGINNGLYILQINSKDINYQSKIMIKN